MLNVFVPITGRSVLQVGSEGSKMGYKMPFNQYKACQKMSKNEFERWLKAFWREAEQQGYQRACDEVPDGSIVINPEDSIVV